VNDQRTFGVTRASWDHVLAARRNMSPTVVTLTTVESIDDGRTTKSGETLLCRVFMLSFFNR
jgi:hypothetical protein